MFNKKALIFLVLLIGILTISSVSANEILNESDGQLNIDDNIVEVDCQDDTDVDSTEDNTILKEDDEYDDDYYPGFEFSNYYDNAYVNLTLPKHAEGSMVVSLIDYDDDYNEIYTEIGNVKLVGGKASFKLPCSELISYEYLAEYTGTDYEVEPVDNYISIIPKVIFSPRVWIGQDNYITFRMPENEQLRLRLYQNSNLLTESVIQDGSKIKLTNLSGGYLDYYLEYYKVDEDWEYSSSEFYLIAMQNSPDFKLNVTVSNEVVGSDVASIRIDLPDGHEYFEDMITVIVDGDESKAIKTDSNDFYIPIGNLTMGTHTVDVICEADDYYKESRAHTTFDVSYIAVNVNENYDHDSVIFVNLIENATGYLALYVDGKIYDVIFPNDEFSLANISMGRHSYEIRYSGDKNYPAYSKKGTFNMDYYFYLDSDSSMIYGTDNQIRVYCDQSATGNVIFTVGGKDYTVKINGGEAILKLPQLAEGTYPVTVTYSGDKIFGPKTLHSEIEVEYGIIIENDHVDLTLPKDAQGNLIASIYDNDDNLLKEYAQTLKDGKASISLSDLDYGEYSVFAYYDGEDYSLSDTSTSIWREETYEDIKVNWPEDITLNKDVYVTVNLPDRFDKSLLNLKLLNDEDEVIMDLKGQTSIKIPTSELKAYHLKVSYGENFVDDAYFDVMPLKVDIPGWYDEVRLGDVISVEMPENAKGKIILRFSDYLTGNFEKEFESGPSVAGKTSITLENLTSKIYVMMVNYVDEVYGNYTLGLRMQIIGQDSDAKLVASDNQDSTTFDLNLNDDAGGEAVLVIDNQTYYSSVDHGDATFNVEKSASEITDALVYYSGDEKYAKFTKNIPVQVKSAPVIVASDVKVTYGANKNLVITLKDENGVLLSDKPISIELNGNIYHRTTNSNGQVSISVPTNLIPNRYSAKISFAGDDTYLLKDKTVKIVVEKAAVKLTAKKATFKVKTKTKKYTVTLKNNKNKVMKNIKVSLKVKGKTYYAKTNSKGKATFKITKLTKKGTHKTVIKFAGNKYYKATSKTIKLTVK